MHFKTLEQTSIIVSELDFNINDLQNRVKKLELMMARTSANVNAMKFLTDFAKERREEIKCRIQN